MSEPSHDDGPEEALSTGFITSRDGLDSLAPEWNELLSDSAADTIFLTWEWVTAWLDSVFPDARLYIVTIRDRDGRLVGIAPFYLAELVLLKTIRYRYLRVLGDCNSGAEYPDVIIRRGFEAPVSKAIGDVLGRRGGRQWDCAWFPNVAGWTGAVDRLEASMGDCRVTSRRHTISFSNMAFNGDYESYIKSLSKNARHSIYRRCRNIELSCDLGVLFCETHAELSEYLDLLFELHRKRWERAGQYGSFVRRPSMVRFYRRFAPVALDNGWLGLFALRVEGKVRALQFGYRYKNVFYEVQGGYDPDGPAGSGNIVRHRLIRTCIENGIREYDFLGDHTESKKRHGGVERFGCHLFIVKPGIKNGLLRMSGVWPSGRFIDQGRPANEGRSHD